MHAELLKVPEKFFTTERTIAWSETDMYRHTNYLSYLKFCYDAAMDAMQDDYYTNFHHDILRYNTRQFTMLYRAESIGGQTLKCKTWEDDVNKNKLYFDFTRDDKVIFQCSMEFYEGEAAKYV